MPARILEKYVNAGIKAGAIGTTPEMVAETIFKIAERGEKIPLRQPLGAVAWKMGKDKFETVLREWEDIKEVSFFGKLP